MREIMLINPTRKRRKKKQTRKPRKVAKPYKKRTSRKTAERSRPMAKRKKAVKRRRRRNPSRRKRIVRRASKAIAGINLMGALKDSLPMAGGMIGSKFFAKLFNDGADELDPSSWTARNYLQMAGGSFATAVLMNTLKRGTGQKACAGGFALLMYELAQNEFIQSNDIAKRWLGQDEYTDEGFMLGEDDEPFIYGDDGQAIPLDDSYRMQLDIPEYAQLPESMEGLEPVSHLGDVIAEPTELGGVRSDLNRAYREMYFNQ